MFTTVPWLDPLKNPFKKYRAPSDSTHAPLAGHDYGSSYAHTSDEGRLEAPHDRDKPTTSMVRTGARPSLKIRERGEQMHNYERAEQEQSKVTVIGQIRAIAFSGWMPGLLMCASVGIALHFAYTNPTARFFVSLVAVVPLAAMLSCATEEFTLKAGEVLGGLLNASVRLVVEMTSSIFALVAHFAKTLLPATALVAMLCYLRQNTRGFALLIALRCLPVVQGSMIGDDHIQPRQDLGPTMGRIGVFLLQVVIVLLIDIVVCGLLYAIVKETATRWNLQGDAKRTHNTNFHALASLCFCFLAILMLNYYFDPKLSNVETWIALVIFTTETIVFLYYHYDYHNQAKLQQKFVPLFAGIVLTLFLWITGNGKPN
jgi:hypothetical protein